LLRSHGALERLEATGTPLGLFKKWDCEVCERQISPGDTLALYTDGITESFSEAREEFGEERLVEALRRHREKSPHELLEAIVEEVRNHSSHEQHDDITVIVARCVERQAPRLFPSA
jgi:serine phosphatase RsbU (regulator of sigma subunit)